MAMKVFNVGDVLGAADVNEYLVNTKYVSKAGDTIRSNTVTPTNDPDLSVAVDANKSYFLVAVINYNSGTSNFRCAFTTPVSSAFAGTVTGVNTSGVFGHNGLDVNGPTQISGAFHAGGVALADATVYYTGVLTTAGSAGNLTLQWCQDNAVVQNTIVRQGSFLLLRRCA